MIKRLATFFLTALLLVWIPSWATTITGKVVAVADGDTITVLDAERVQHKIRLSGIDTPERKQAFGQQAKLHLSDLVFGKTVEVETEKQDRYARSVGKVMIEGRDVNLAMIHAGLAWHYKKYQHEQAHNERLLYAQAEELARNSGVGLWSAPQPVPPWIWRAAQKQQLLQFAE